MKFIRKFNEAYTGIHLEEMRETCKLLLIDLIEKGSDLKIGYNLSNYEVFKSQKDLSFRLFIGYIGLDNTLLTWKEVKLVFIPFIQMFVNYYGEINNISIQPFSTEPYKLSYDELIEDSYLDDTRLLSISFSF